ncbi:hypothetical protein BCR34DRAFT_657673 [Clohesyomyces aquaticus]|uniref:Rhodopsin domain-containing protein n=1 Tax=Clohesyomyces aquaticus TaxID=1231657 RepID=A0A1Y1ZFH4_9PLEO|nr:hypothetical protein BCR34DRAFT_657673 [Clohesyomyces aquaticus]
MLADLASLARVGIDDLVVLISTSLTLGFSGCNYVSAGSGLGHPIDDIRSSPQSTIHRLNASITSGQITWILSLCLSKIAAITVLMRTTVTPSHRNPIRSVDRYSYPGHCRHQPHHCSLRVLTASFPAAFIQT